MNIKDNCKKIYQSITDNVLKNIKNNKNKDYKEKDQDKCIKDYFWDN